VFRSHGQRIPPHPAEIVARELGAYRAARRSRNSGRAWSSLERAHIAGQASLRLHAETHLRMLGYAIAQRDADEAVGQLIRLLLVPLGHATGRLPLGNSGRTRDSAFKPMPLPPDLAVELGIQATSTSNKD
jgi:hypothetical protein